MQVGTLKQVMHEGEITKTLKKAARYPFDSGTRSGIAWRDRNTEKDNDSKKEHRALNVGGAVAGGITGLAIGGPIGGLAGALGGFGVSNIAKDAKDKIKEKLKSRK